MLLKELGILSIYITEEGDLRSYFNGKRHFPSEPAEYTRKEDLERALDIGEYIPYPTRRQTAEFMFKLAVMKHIYNRPEKVKTLLKETEEYISEWGKCFTDHQEQEGMFSHSSDFQNTITESFANMMY